MSRLEPAHAEFESCLWLEGKRISGIPGCYPATREELKTQLSSPPELKLNREIMAAMTVETRPPFREQAQLEPALSLLHPGVDIADLTLPGHPRMKFANIPALTSFLESELCSPELDAVAPKLWMMSKQSGSNISPLHRQRVKGREIIPTEEPHLHLVWIQDRIFIKPLPRYLLSYKFWEIYLLCDKSPLGAKRHTLLKSALGYLRTYYYLVKHESDFERGCDSMARLIPENVTWEQFSLFSEFFHDITDHEVSERYAYGELRLSRLNFYFKFWAGKFHFHRTHYQYGAYFGRYYSPFVFVFGTITVVLGALQVEVAVEQATGTSAHGIFSAIRGFCIMVVGFVCVSALFFALLWTYKFVAEWCFAIKCRMRKAKHTTIEL